MTFKYNKLKGKIIEKFGSQRRFAEELGCSEALVTKKLTNIVRFDTEDVVQWCDLLEIEVADIPFYFFVLDVQ